MILDGKKFEYGLCPSCGHRRPVWEDDGLCYGCGGHAEQVRCVFTALYLLTVDWCNEGKRGVFCDKHGRGFKKETKHTDMEMLEILGAFYAILSPKSELFTAEEVKKYNLWKPLGEYRDYFGIAVKPKGEAVVCEKCGKKFVYRNKEETEAWLDNHICS